MDERVQRLEQMSCDYVDLADRIHAGSADADECYDELRTRLSRWRLAVDNVAWLAMIDRKDIPVGFGGRTSSTRQIKACLTGAKRMMDEKWLHVRTNALEDIEIACNPDVTRIIWDNILDNAIKYTSESGHIWISARKLGDFAEITFRDDGKGISEANLPKVFDRYAQFETERQNQGLGLGLAVVKEATMSMHGEIICSSELGKGTTIQLRLPLLKEQEK